MITLITAVPGSGKTLYSIGLIVEALKEGRPVFHNINGLVVDKFPNNHLLNDAPDDWRDCPNGSLVIYDEAQQPHLYPSNAQRGKVEDERLTAMETHRHGGYDLVFITQAPTFVHHHIRKLVGQHIHLYRGRGVKGAVRYEWSHTCESPNDRREQERAVSAMWPFPKEYFAYYTSAVMHTHKFKLPFKLVLLILAVLGGLVFIVSNLVSNDGLAVLSEKSLPVVADASLSLPVPAQRPYAWSSASAAVPVAGCISSATKCMCFSADGVTLEMEDSACMSIIKSPLPRQFIASKRTTNT